MKNRRRHLLKALTLGGGALTATKLPSQWIPPVVESVTLPAHAQTSGLVSTGTTQSTTEINAFNSPNILDAFIPAAYAPEEPPANYEFSICIRMSLATRIYDAFVIVNDFGFFPSYRGSGIQANTNEDTTLTYDGDCPDGETMIDSLVPSALANGLGVQVRVFNVSGSGADVEVEIESSRWTGFLNWNGFGCGLSCGELELPYVFPSDRKLKEKFETVDEQAILEKVAGMPVEYWSYTDRDPDVRHIGPMAQDFYSSFNVGGSDKHIHMVDANGVNLASIKALYIKMQEKDEKISKLEDELRRIKDMLGLST